MPLLLSTISEEEVPIYSRIYNDSFAPYPMHRALVEGPETDSLRTFCANRDLKEFRTRFKRNLHYLKVTDTDTGDIIAVAKWRLEDDESYSEGASQIEYHPQMKRGAREVYFPMLDAERKKIMCKTEYWHLLILNTKAGHERRGAGSMLVQWGMEQADREGLGCYVNGSEVGRPLYEKLGFEAVRMIELDLSPYGVNHINRTCAMVRRGRKVP